MLFEYIKTKTFNPETKPTNDIAIETIKYDKKHKLILFVIIPSNSKLKIVKKRIWQGGSDNGFFGGIITRAPKA